MKQQQSLALGAMIAVAVGLVGTTAFVSATAQPELTDMEALAVESGIFGHLEIVLKDADGTIKAYRQTDNVVFNEGKDCALELIFSEADLAGGDACPLTTFTKGFDSIVLISSGTPGASDTQASHGTLTEVSAAGLAASDGLADAITFVSTGKVDITIQFLKTAAGSQTVTGALLKDDISSPEAMFAGNTFTSVSMDENDTLDVTWTITLS